MKLKPWSGADQDHHPDQIIGGDVSKFYTYENNAEHLPGVALNVGIEGRFAREDWRLRKDGSPLGAYVTMMPYVEMAAS